MGNAELLMVSGQLPQDTTGWPLLLTKLLPSNWPLDVPLARITTCGCSPLVIEVLHRFEELMTYQGPIYGPPLEEAWQSGGASKTALALLSLLTSQPGCFASQDALSQALRPGKHAASSQTETENDEFEDHALKRPDNVVTFLRRLLYPPALAHLPEAHQRILRNTLIRRIKASQDSGPGYALAPLPLIWLDVEAMEAHYKRIAVLEQFGEDALSEWQTISAIGLRGPFLPQESYSDWVAWRRTRVGDLLWQSVDAQQRRALAQENRDAGEEIAMKLLFVFWQGHQTNEDAFRQLAELLGKRERFQQAEECYAQLCTALEQEGRVPHARTEKVMEFVRARTSQRSPVLPLVVQESSLSVEHSPLFLPSANLAQLLPLEIAPDDIATWMGIRLAYLINIIHQWGGQAMSCDILQALLDREIAMFDLQKTTQKEAFLLSRRQVLITLASLPTMLASSLLTSTFFVQPEEFLPQCAASVTACWHLLRGREFLLIEKLLTRHLPTLADMAHQSSLYQVSAARLATQGYRLMGIIALHRGGAHARTAYFEQAVHFAEIAKTPNLLATALISLAYHNNDPEQAATLYQRGADDRLDLSPLVLARLYARLAVVSAQQARETDALHYLQQAQETYPMIPEKDPGFLYAEFCPSSLTMEVGLTYLALAHSLSTPRYAQQAREVFAGVDNVRKPIPAPVRIRYEIINHEARTTLTLNDLEAFCSLLEQGVYGAKLLQSDQRRQEALDLYKDARARWPEEARVRSLADLLL